MAAGPTYDPIATTTLSSAASSITFSSIPSTYTDLRVVLVGTQASNYIPSCVFNSDTGTNYSYTELYGTGSSAGSIKATTTSVFYLGESGGWNSTTPSLVTMDIFSYAGSTYKTSLITFSEDFNGSGFVGRSVGLWRSTSAITSVTLRAFNGTANFSIGTTATLYGILKA